MNQKIITLSGLGDFSEDENQDKYNDIKRAAKKHHVEFYPTYYDHELKGAPDAIEALTQELWSMPRDQWADNNLTETEV